MLHLLRPQRIERYPHEGEAGGETMTPSPFNVLRLGYRKGRDPRITTHLALVSRALGATNFMLAGDEDPDLFENVASAVSYTHLRAHET